MTSAAPSNTLSRHTGVVDGQNYSRGPQYSFFAPKGSGTMSPFVSDWHTYDASTVGAMGSSSKFAIPNNAFTYASHLLLGFEFDTQPVVAPVQILDEFTAMSAVELVTLQYGSNPICTVSGEQMRCIPYRRWLEEKKADLADEIGDRTVAERTADAVNGRKYLLEIPMTLFNESNPLPMAMGNDLIVTVKWRSASEMFHSAVAGVPCGAATLTFLAGSQKLYVRGVHVPEDEQVALQNMANSNTGIIKRLNQISSIDQSFTFAAPNTAAEMKVDLKQFSLPHSQLTFIIRDVANLDTPYDVRRFQFLGSDADPTLTVTSYGITDASGVLKAQVDHSLYKYSHHGRQTSALGSVCFDLLEALDPQNDQTFSGSSNTAQSNSPYLNITANVKAAGTYRVTVFAELLNFTQIKKGQFRTIHLQ